MKTVLTVIMACMCAYGWGANKTESEYLKKFKENISSCIKHNALEFKNINKDLAYYPPDSTEWKEAKIKKDQLVNSIQSALLKKITNMPEPDKTTAKKYYDLRIEALQNAGVNKNGKTIEPLVDVTCKACDGKGQIQGKLGKCECCRGSGIMEIDPTAPYCSKCSGSGKVYQAMTAVASVCSQCKGKGTGKDEPQK